MRTWTPEEVRILKENYNSVSNSVLSSLIPNKTPQGIYKKAYKLGLRKNADIEFLNRSEARRRDRGSNWKGGCRKTQKGYLQILVPDHPRADSSGYVMEHILVWENATGVPVPDNCCIHHLNENKADNRISNLCLMERGAHTTHHHTGSRRSETTRQKMKEKRKQRC